jgi:hypothetical protein
MIQSAKMGQHSAGVDNAIGIILSRSWNVGTPCVEVIRGGRRHPELQAAPQTVRGESIGRQVQSGAR